MARDEEDPPPPVDILGDEPAAESVEIITSGPRRRPSRGLALGVAAAVAMLVAGSLALDDDPSGTDLPEAEDGADGTTPEDDSSTTRPEPTTTTSLLAGAPLLGAPSGMLLVTSPYTSGLRSRLIDLDTGEITELDGRVMDATEEGLLVQRDGTVVLWPSPYDGSGSKQIAAIPRGQIVAETWVVDDGVWLLFRPPAPGELGAPGHPASADLVDLDGRSLAHLDLRDDLWPSGVIDRGVVASGPGGVYAIDRRGNVERISIGDLVAVAHNQVHVFTCDERFQCSIELLGGQGQPVDRRASSDPSPDGLVSEAIPAPDGRLATIVYRDMTGQTNQVAVDGVPVFEAAVFNTPTWSPDGRWLAIPALDGIHLIDTRHHTEPVVLEVGNSDSEFQLFVSR